MRIRNYDSIVDSETGAKIGGEQVLGEDQVAHAAESGANTPAPAIGAGAAGYLKGLIDKALAGTLPLDRPLHEWEPDKLKARHIEWIFDHIAGLTNTEIAAKYDYSLVRVSVILSSPHAQALIAAIMSVKADSVVDVTERLSKLANEALNVKVDLMRTSQSGSLRDKIATDILDRAGYGARTKVDVGVKHSFSMPAQAATRLESVLDEANQVASIDYSQHLKPLGSEAAQLSQLIGAGHTETVESLPSSPVSQGSPLNEKVA